MTRMGSATTEDGTRYEVEATEAPLPLGGWSCSLYATELRRLVGNVEIFKDGSRTVIVKDKEHSERLEELAPRLRRALGIEAGAK